MHAEWGQNGELCTCGSRTGGSACGPGSEAQRVLAGGHLEGSSLQRGCAESEPDPSCPRRSGQSQQAPEHDRLPAGRPGYHGRHAPPHHPPHAPPVPTRPQSLQPPHRSVLQPAHRRRLLHALLPHRAQHGRYVEPGTPPPGPGWGGSSLSSLCCLVLPGTEPGTLRHESVVPLVGD